MIEAFKQTSPPRCGARSRYLRRDGHRGLVPGRGADRTEEWTSGYFGRQRHKATTTGRSTPREHLPVGCNLPKRRTGTAPVRPHANTEAMQLHLDGISNRGVSGPLRRAAGGLLWVDRLSRMTTVPGSRAGASWVSIQVSNAGPLMAPVMTRGAISAFVSAPR